MSSPNVSTTEKQASPTPKNPGEIEIGSDDVQLPNTGPVAPVTGQSSEVQPLRASDLGGVANVGRVFNEQQKEFIESNRSNSAADAEQAAQTTLEQFAVALRRKVPLTPLRSGSFQADYEDLRKFLADRNVLLEYSCTTLTYNTTPPTVKHVPSFGVFLLDGKPQPYDLSTLINLPELGEHQRNSFSGSVARIKLEIVPPANNIIDGVKKFTAKTRIASDGTHQVLIDINELKKREDLYVKLATAGQLITPYQQGDFEKFILLNEFGSIGFMNILRAQTRTDPDPSYHTTEGDAKIDELVEASGDMCSLTGSRNHQFAVLEINMLGDAPSYPFSRVLFNAAAQESMKALNIVPDGMANG